MLILLQLENIRSQKERGSDFFKIMEEKDQNSESLSFLTVHVQMVDAGIRESKTELAQL